MPETKTHVLLVYGGRSSEHDISLMSGRNVQAALDTSRYDVSVCVIDKEGRWWLQDETSQAVEITPILGQKKFVALAGDHTVQPDVIVPILHGKNGEDGTVQGLCELLGVPYVGPSLLGAALTMDKDLTKRVLHEGGIPVVEGVVWKTSEERPTYADISNKLGSAVFVKPSRAGSSVGVSKATDETSFTAALTTAAEHDDKVLIERAIQGREIELAVLGNSDPQVSVPGEILPGADFYDFDDKYDVSSAAKVQIPAEISEQTVASLQQAARAAYMMTAGRGMARVDFFLVDDGTFYLNEINSIPGFTDISMYPKLWQHGGLTYPELLSRLINLALE